MKRHGVLLLLAIWSCSPQRDTKPSFTLKCSGPTKATITQHGEPTQVLQQSSGETFYYWNGASRKLDIRRDGLKRAPLCEGLGVVKCTASADGGRLIAVTIDYSPNDDPRTTNIYEQKIDINLTTLTGTAQISTAIMKKAVEGPDILQHLVAIRTRLKCQRAKT